MEVKQVKLNRILYRFVIFLLINEKLINKNLQMSVRSIYATYLIEIGRNGTDKPARLVKGAIESRTLFFSTFITR